MKARLAAFAVLTAIATFAAACSKSDAEITARVQNRLAADETTKNAKIIVTSVSQAVTLTGTVESATAKSKALELTRATDGVRDVVDKLTVTAAAAQSAIGGSPSAGLSQAAAATAGMGARMIDMHRGEMGIPPEGMMRDMARMASSSAPSSSALAPSPPTARALSALPGMPGVSHLYHIGSTGFFLDQPQIQLTSDQQSRLRQIMERALLERGNRDRAIEQAEQELWALTGDGTDSARAEAKIAEIERTRANQRIDFIRAVGEAVDVLAAEQRTALVGTIAKK